MVEIQEVLTKKDLKQFILFPRKLYADNPNWIPDLISDELTNLNSRKNPAFNFCEARYFLAKKHGEIVGRIAGIINNKSNNKWQQKRMRISRFDFIDDNETVDALLGAVESYAKEKGILEVHGPLGFTDLDKEGALIEGFDRRSTFFTYYNAPYYQTQYERCGYNKDIDWVEYLAKIPQEASEKISRICDVVKKRNKITRFEFKTKRQLKPRIREIFDLINEAYAGLYGVTEITEEQKDVYVDQFLALINPDYLILLLDKEDKLCAFGLGIPSMADAVKKSKGRLFPVGWIRLYKAIQANDTLDLCLIAVRPDLQKAGLTAVLMHEMTISCARNNIKQAESGPELELNENVQALWKHYDVEIHKRRRCFIKTI